MKLTDYEGRVVVVTGGANGIGEATVRRFGGLGATVVIADKDPDRGAVVESEMRSVGERGHLIVTDVREPGDVKRLFEETMSTFGRVDVLDNNVAGALELAMDDGNLVELDPGLFMESMRGNVLPVLLTCRLAIPIMLAQGGGSIVNIASVTGMMGESQLTAYGASKAAVIQLTRSIATQYGRQGIRVNAVAPAFVTTRNNALFAPPELQAAYERSVRSPRLSSPVDIANAVVFLSSDEAALINGQTLAVDGGLSIVSPIVEG